VPADKPPPRAVLDAFGASVDPVPLTGGQEKAWQAQDLVLKPLDMSVEELQWQEGVLAALVGAGDVRVAPPVRSTDGSLVVAGWTAWRYGDGSPATPERYGEVVAAGRVFHERLRRCPRPTLLDSRDHPWAQADRVAWGEAPLDDDGARLPHVAALLELRRPVGARAQLVHGDLTDNVHLHPDLPPLVLDFSPYWRPTSYASAIVVADAVVFRGAGDDLVEEVRAEEGAEFPQMLVRALLFRAVADHLLAPDKGEAWAHWFAPAVRVAAELVGGR
jgi:uncharacterized protein (TIGR02569 family)